MEANNENDVHFQTPLAFAKWRVNELKKPRQSGIINETIDTVIQSVNGILGQYNRDNVETDIKYQTWFEKFDKKGVMRDILGNTPSMEELKNKPLIILNYFGSVFVLFIFFWLNLMRFFISIFTSSLPQTDDFVKSYGNWGRIIVPLALYILLFGLTIVSSHNYNIYRLLVLLLVFIISYTELKYVGFMSIFLLSIVVETWILQK